MQIREAVPEDLDALMELYPAAFPEEDLTCLVRSLTERPGVLSLVAEVEGALVGHATFTPSGLEGRDARLYLLGPLAVAPASQRQGIGTALIEAGCALLAAEGVSRVLVLGDPAYYGLRGFAPTAGIVPPYPLPEEWQGAWQCRDLAERAVVEGRLTVPAPWRRAELWSN